MVSHFETRLYIWFRPLIYMKMEVWVVLALLFIPQCILAVCPVCTVAVAGGVELSRWLGVDDVISGLWIGALIISSALWFSSWMDSKSIKINRILVLGSFYLIVILPLYWMKLIDFSCNLLFGFDKLLLGIISGSIVFSGSIILNNLLKKKNNNKVYFPYQKVIIPVLFLIIGSIIFYLVTIC